MVAAARRRFASWAPDWPSDLRVLAWLVAALARPSTDCWWISSQASNASCTPEFECMAERPKSKCGLLGSWRALAPSAGGRVSQSVQTGGIPSRHPHLRFGKDAVAVLLNRSIVALVAGLCQPHKLRNLHRESTTAGGRCVSSGGHRLLALAVLASAVVSILSLACASIFACTSCRPARLPKVRFLLLIMMVPSRLALDGTGDRRGSGMEWLVSWHSKTLHHTSPYFPPVEGRPLPATLRQP